MFYAERAELLEGRLRQGWGFPGGDVRLGSDSYLNAWKVAGWPLDENEKSRSIGPMRRYSVLKRMLDIQRDDLIVIPRVSVEVDGDGDFFTIATVVNTYSFKVLNGFADFGHIIEVDPERLRSYRYDRDADRLNSAVNSLACTLMDVPFQESATATVICAQLFASSHNSDTRRRLSSLSVMLAALRRHYRQLNRREHPCALQITGIHNLAETTIGTEVVVHKSHDLRRSRFLRLQE